MARFSLSPGSKPRTPVIDRLRGWAARSIENRIAGGSLALSLATLLLFGALSYHFSRTLIENNIEASVNQQAELAATKIEAVIDHLVKEHSALASSTLTANALTDSQGRNAYLTPFLRQSWISTDLGFPVALCDFRGALVSATSESGPDICREFAFAREVVEGNRRRAVIFGSEEKYIAVAAPVIYLATGQPEGLLVARGPVKNLLERNNVRVPDQFSFDIKDAAGRSILGRQLGEAGDSRLLALRPLAMAPPLDTLKLVLQLRADEGPIYGPLRWVTAIYVALGLLVVGLVTAASRIVARRVALPLLSMVTAAERVAANARADEAVPVQGKDEVAQLAEAFNKMLHNLRASYDLLEHRVEERTRDLRSAEQRLSSVLNSVDDIIWSMSPDGKRLLYINPAIETIAGVKLEDFYASPSYGKLLTHPDDRERFRAAVLAAIAQGGTEVEIRIVRADGGVAWLRCRLRAIHGDEGAVTRIDGIATDITEWRRAQAIIEENAHRLNSIFLLSPDGFVTFDSQGKLASLNPAFSRMTGLTGQQLIGIDLAAFDGLIASLSDPAQPFTPTSELFTKLLAGGPESTIDRSLESAVIHLSHPQQRVLSRSARSGPAGWPEVVLYFRDITHESEVDRMKSEFLSTAAHELRTPMASIYGFSELLLKRKYDEKTQRDLLETINRQAQLLTKMINELLDLARIEARAGKDFNFRRHDLNEIIENTLQGLMVPGDPRRVETVLPESLPAVLADSEKLQQALTNVLGNAYKYSPNGGPITLTVSRRSGSRGEQVGLTVSDQGIGMTPDQAARSFERFYRADASGAIPGTGLGLALVREIIEIHNGQVTLDSEFGRGTRVTLWLPVDQQTADARDTAGALGHDHASGRPG